MTINEIDTKAYHFSHSAARRRKSERRIQNAGDGRPTGGRGSMWWARFVRDTADSFAHQLFPDPDFLVADRPDKDAWMVAFTERIRRSRLPILNGQLLSTWGIRRDCCAHQADPSGCGDGVGKDRSDLFYNRWLSWLSGVCFVLVWILIPIKGQVDVLFRPPHRGIPS